MVSGNRDTSNIISGNCISCSSRIQVYDSQPENVQSKKEMAIPMDDLWGRRGVREASVSLFSSMNLETRRTEMGMQLVVSCALQEKYSNI